MNEERTLFSSELLREPGPAQDGACLSVIATVLGTELGILQRILDTVSLTLEQWVICVLAAALIIVVSEVKKLLKIGRAPSREPAPAAPSPAPATS